MATTNRDKLLNKINAYSDVELGIFMHLHNISTNDDNNVEDWSDTDYTHWLSQEAEEDTQEEIQIHLTMPEDENTRKAIEYIIPRLTLLSARLDKLEKCNRIVEVKEHIEGRIMTQEEVKKLTNGLVKIQKSWGL